jgi:hypothetical protein
MYCRETREIVTEPRERFGVGHYVGIARLPGRFMRNLSSHVCLCLKKLRKENRGDGMWIWITVGVALAVSLGAFSGFGYRLPWTGYGETSYSKPKEDR